MNLYYYNYNYIINNMKHVHKVEKLFLNPITN